MIGIGLLRAVVRCGAWWCVQAHKARVEVVAGLVVSPRFVPTAVFTVSRQVHLMHGAQYEG